MDYLGLLIRIIFHHLETFRVFRLVILIYCPRFDVRKVKFLFSVRRDFDVNFISFETKSYCRLVKKLKAHQRIYR